MSLRVHLLEAFEEFDSDFVELLTPRLDPGIALSEGPEISGPRDVQVLVAGVPERRTIEVCTGLTTLVIPWSGLPRRTRELMLDFPHIAVHNLHYNAAAVAEQALTLMFAAAKRLIEHDRRLRAGDWRPRYAPAEAILLAGKTVLIVGYGAIGQRIGAACHALGATVCGIRESGRPCPNGIAEVYPPDALMERLPHSSVLFVATPWTPDTDGLIGEQEIGLLPDGAVVVNVARGAVVDEHALYRALVDRRIAAGIDVWYRYPESTEARTVTRPAHFPFWGLDNVVMTPHLAGHTVGLELLLAEELAHLLNAAARGEPLPNRVRVHRGF